jgi:hypothetical protein
VGSCGSLLRWLGEPTCHRLIISLLTPIRRFISHERPLTPCWVIESDHSVLTNNKSAASFKCVRLALLKMRSALENRTSWPITTKGLTGDNPVNPLVPDLPGYEEAVKCLIQLGRLHSAEAQLIAARHLPYCLSSTGNYRPLVY